MVRWAKLDIHRGKIPSLDEVEEARSSVFIDKIRATLDAKEFKPHDQLIDRLLDQGYASTDICSALIHLLQNSGSGKGDKASGRGKPAGGSTAPANSRGKGPNVEPPARASKPAPAWVQAATAAKPGPVAAAEDDADAAMEPDANVRHRPTKQKYERPARTGREPGMATVFLNVGRKQLVTPADIVGKIAGVTRLPADVVGAIDIHQRHTLADVAEAEAALIVKKLAGIKLKGVMLAPALAGAGAE
jgi:ATP-dependent RNA helicase DeaD